MDPIGAEKGVVFFFVIIFVAPRGPTYDATNYWRELTKVQFFTRAHPNSGSLPYASHPQVTTSR